MKVPPKLLRTQVAALTGLAPKSDSPPPDADQTRSEVPELLLPDASRTRAIQEHAGALPQTTDDMPILEAFQAFLEAERRKARNRILGLMGFCAALLIALAGAATLIALTFLDQVQGDLSDVLGTAATAKEQSTEARKLSESAVARLDDGVATLRNEMEEKTARTSQELGSRLLAHGQEMENMGEIIKVMQAENAVLRSNVEASVEAIAGAIADALPRQRPRGEFIAMVITRPRTGRTVSWRLPTSE